MSARRRPAAVGGRRQAVEGIGRGKERLRDRLGWVGGCCAAVRDCAYMHVDRGARRRRLRSRASGNVHAVGD